MSVMCLGYEGLLGFLSCSPGPILHISTLASYLNISLALCIMSSSSVRTELLCFQPTC